MEAHTRDNKAGEYLAELIDRALNGVGVVITRDGTPVAELRAIRPAPGPITEADLAWLDARRVTPQEPLAEDAAMRSPN